MGLLWGYYIIRRRENQDGEKKNLCRENRYAVFLEIAVSQTNAFAKLHGNYGAEFDSCYSGSNATSSFFGVETSLDPVPKTAMK